MSKWTCCKEPFPIHQQKSGFLLFLLFGNKQFQRSKIILFRMFDKYQSSHFQNLNTAKGNSSNLIPSKTHIINWIKTMFPDLPSQLKIQDFGNGVLYCRIINHYYPSAIPPAKMFMNPKTEYEFANNLKLVQQALVQHELNIHFDVAKVSKRKFLQNWALINAIYKHFQSEDIPEEVSFFSNHKPVGKRTFDMAFPEDQYGSAQKLQSNSQLNGNFNYILPVWDKSSLNLCFNQNDLKLKNYQRDNASPVKGKWSVNSQMFQNNQSAVVDRVKQILLKSFQDGQKVRQIKMLLNISSEEEDIIKLQEDDEIFCRMGFHMKEIKQEKEESYMQRNEKEKYQSETNSEKIQSRDRLLCSMKGRKPFKV